jgi:2-polyprenyl-3-methyl-5-hydroxy-6-metoxy-1,4-benzoquinol methylase/uncharacterized protein YbaR (Trm112 family)
MNFQGVELCCPRCRQDLRPIGGSLQCKGCGHSFPVVLGIPDLRVFPDPYIEPEADRAKGQRVAEHFHAFNFSELIDYYYSITSVVPAHHARLYKSGLLAGEDRARTALASWAKMTGTNGNGHSLLDVGCGTAPLLVAAAQRFRRVVGVDIAFRWLVMGKKRLLEAGLDIPLICACAEALPFPDGTFDRVVLDSTIEHVQDQRATLTESYRAMTPRGALLMSTPNRFSLGPDPHVGLWAGGYLPDRWLAAYARRQGAVPPHRHLLSVHTLAGLVRRAGFRLSGIFPPRISEAQRNQFGKEKQWLIDSYQLAQRLPFSRQLLLWIGPLLHAVAMKPGM